MQTERDKILERRDGARREEWVNEFFVGCREGSVPYALSENVTATARVAEHLNMRCQIRSGR